MNMIIMSADGDASTSDVIEWIDFFGHRARRINGMDIGFSLNLNSDRNETVVENETSSVDCSLWLRKGGGETYTKLSSDENEMLEYQVNLQARSEYHDLRQAFINSFKKERILGNRDGDVNKIQALHTASKCGLIIPETLVTNRKSTLRDFFNSHDQQVICKPLSHIGFFGIKPYYWGMYSSRLSEGFISKLPDKFPPCLVQEYIEKEYEVRTFYLGTNCYSMAIFSQAVEQTSVDFRRYNTSNPNRNVPYLLPDDVEEKVIVFMKAMGLNTGSFDFIRKKDGSYVFLEVNVAGQFSMVSYPCNFYLERKIAEWLIKAS